MIPFLYNVAVYLLLVAGSPFWLLLLLLRSRYREGVRERLGWLSGSLLRSAGRPRVWLHAVSVGEVLAVSRLVEELDRKLPAFQVVVSTTTRTGQQMARARFGRERCFYFPFDIPLVVARVLKLLRPAVLILAESELWPGVLEQCRSAGVPVVIVNGRISDRSFPRYKALRWFWRSFFPALTLVLTQSEEDRLRFIAAGVQPRAVRCTGNLKFDVRAPAETDLVKALRPLMLPPLRVLVCGSTLDEEEALLLRSWERLRGSAFAAIMILAPRHPERFERIADLLANSGLPYLRRSTWEASAGPLAPGTVFLLDSVGELAAAYGLGSVAFVGGSLVPAGGHNPLEPARFGVPVVMGPSRENFRGVTDQLLAAGALVLVTPETLYTELERLLSDAGLAHAIGARGRESFEAQSGATGRVVEAICSLLPQAEVPQ